MKPLSGAERRAIETFLGGAVDLDDVVTRSVKLLAQLTRQVAVVQYPTLARSTVRHVELVPLRPTGCWSSSSPHRARRTARRWRSPSRSTAVTSTTCAGAEQGAGRASADEAAAALTNLLVGRTARAAAGETSSTLVETLGSAPERWSSAAPRTSRSTSPRCMQAGARSARGAGRAAQAARRGERPHTVRVRIGDENPKGLRSTSVVSIGYGAGATRSPRSASSGRPGWTTPPRRASFRC